MKIKGRKKLFNFAISTIIAMGLSSSVTFSAFASSCQLINRGSNTTSKTISNTSNTGEKIENKNSNENEFSNLSISNLVPLELVDETMAYLKEISTTYALRYSESEANLKLSEYLKSKLESFGYKVDFERFTDESGYWNGDEDEKTTGRNIVATLKNPDLNKKNVIIVSHYDTFNVTPGANDNGTGVVCNLISAKYLMNKDLPFNPIFLFVDGEELGLMGSRAFVRDHMEDLKETTELVINLDMVGVGKTILVNNLNEENSKLKYPKMAKYIGEKLGLDMGIEIAANSDFASFERAGINTFGLFTDSGVLKGQDKTYHKPTDVYENIDKRNIENILNIIFNVLANIN